MQPFVGSLARRKRRRTLSPEFQHALALEVLKTERLRIIALIVVATVLAVGLGTIDRLAPAVLDRIWHGRFPVLFLATSYVVFVLFEASILLLITRQIKRGGDVPQLRRYFNALVETSVPSVVIATHMSNMGAAQALAFVGPLLYFVFIILSTLRLDFWLSAFTGFVAGAELLGLTLLHPATQAAASDPTLAAPFVMSRSAVLFACGVIAGAVGTQLRRQFEASIAAASTRTPQQVVDRLDAAFAVLVDIVDRNGGIVNKFLGDGFLALFGAPFEDPNAAARAVTAAREMLAAIEQHNVESDWPLRIGIGLHLGSVVAGSVGSPRRKEYTVIGDTVNLASRIEGLNKEFGSQLLISDAVHQEIGNVEGAVSLGDVPVRGYQQPIRVWRLA